MDQPGTPARQQSTRPLTGREGWTMAPSRSLLVAAYLILACACGGGGGGDGHFYKDLPPSGDVAGYRIALRKFARERGFAVVGMKTPAVNESGATVASNLLQGLREASIN